MLKKSFMMSLLLFIGILVFLGSCVTQEKCSDKFPCDSIVPYSVKTDTIHDTVNVFIPYQELSFDTTSPCPPEINYHKSIKKDWLTAYVDISNGQIRFYVKEEAHEKKIEAPIRTTTITKVVYKDRDKIVKEQYTPTWKNVLCWLNIFWILLVAFILYLAFKWK